MKTTKRITAFFMAIIICASFCMTQVAALQNDFYGFMGNSEEVYFFGENNANDSRAYVSCTEWGWDEVGTCNFEAITKALNIYLNTTSVYYIRAYVGVSVFNEPDYYASDEDIDYTNSEYYAEARVDYTNLTDMDNGIEYFTSHHEINGMTWVNGVLTIVEDIGPTIYIGTSY